MVFLEWGKTNNKVDLMQSTVSQLLSQPSKSSDPSGFQVVVGRVLEDLARDLQHKSQNLEEKIRNLVELRVEQVETRLRDLEGRWQGHREHVEAHLQGF